MLQRLRENKSMQGTFLALPTTIWLFVLLIIPLFLTLVVSFGQRSPDGDVIYSFGLHNYIRLLGYSTDCPDGQSACFDPLYVNILWRSLVLAFNTTVIVIMMAYPLAYFIARSHPNRRNMFLFMVLIPLWTNFVIRVYAWMMLLRSVRPLTQSPSAQPGCVPSRSWIWMTRGEAPGLWAMSKPSSVMLRP